MVRLRGSTCALGLEAICLGSVMACGAGSVWAASGSATMVLMSMTIANETKVRMRLRALKRPTTKSLSKLAAAIDLSVRVLVQADGAPSLVGGVADIFEQAVDALGLASDAELASVPDDLVRKKYPLFAGNDAHQVLLDFLRIGIRGQLEAAR